MLDVVFLAMFAVLPAMGLSIYLARYKGRWDLHKKIQLTLAAILVVAVVLFELDMQINGWRHRASSTPDGPVPNAVWYALYTHLVFAITTPLLWTWVIVQALRKFSSPPQPGDHSAQHKRWATLASLDMVATAVTGWIFYYVAFIA